MGIAEELFADLERLQKKRDEALSLASRWSARYEPAGVLFAHGAELVDHDFAAIEKRLTPRWERFAAKLREETGFRADLRVGDVHEAERLVSIDPARITHPDSWRPDPKPAQVRYGWRYADGRVVEKEAELEDTDVED